MKTKKEMVRTLFSIFFWIYFSVCVLIILTLTVVLRLFTFPFDPYKKLPNKTLYLLAFFVMKINPGWSITIEGEENYTGQEPTVFVGNHQSFLDLPLVYLLPWKMKWVAKKELFQIPILGWLVWITGHLSVDRSKRTSITRLDNLVQPLNDNVPVMIFPEGTRSPNGELRRFKSGAFMLAKRNGFMLQPMVLNGGHRALPSNSWKLKLRQHFHLSVLEPIDPNNFQSIEELKNHVYKKIERELARIRGKKFICRCI